MTGYSPAGMLDPASSAPARLDPASRFRIEVTESSDFALVVPSGDLDLHSAPELRDRLAALADDGTTRVIVDLGACTFLDSMALSVLASATKRLGAANGHLAVVVPAAEVRRIFEITMLDRILDLHETRADAIGAAREG